MTLNQETKIRPDVLAAYDRSMAIVADHERHLLASAATWRGVGMAPTAEVPDAPALRAAARWWGARFRVAADRAQELAQ